MIVDVVYAEDGERTRRVIERGSCWIVGWWFKPNGAYKKYAWTLKSPLTGQATCARVADDAQWFWNLGNAERVPVARCERVLGRWWEA